MPPADPFAHPSLVAILRGLTPERAIGVGGVLRDAGIRIIEVPLNSPDPYASIAKLCGAQGADCVIGAGTVTSVEQVEAVHRAGARLAVAPNCDARVIRAAIGLGMTMIPGIATATEAFEALDAGADTLKLFPASTYGPRHLKALRDVLPARIRVLPVGGIGADDFGPWLAAGAAGFGCGSELFRPGYTIEDIAARASRLQQALHRVLPAD